MLAIHFFDARIEDEYGLNVYPIFKVYFMITILVLNISAGI